MNSKKGSKKWHRLHPFNIKSNPLRVAVWMLLWAPAVMTYAAMVACEGLCVGARAAWDHAKESFFDVCDSGFLSPRGVWHMNRQEDD